MINRTSQLRRLAGLGAAVAMVAVAAPVAVADPQTRYSPFSQAASPRLGEHLSGRDRVWLPSSPQSAAPRLGERLSGADRSWLAPGSVGPSVALPSGDGFNWSDAGIGAGTAVGGLLLAAAGTLMIRRRATPAH